MSEYALAAGSEEFWRLASADIAAARARVLVQAMTFEGDSAGRAVANAINASAAADRRVLVDDYTRHNLNDTMLLFSRDEYLRAEQRKTKAMFDRLVAGGAGVRITDPVGGNPLRFVSRNHKKLLVMDDVAWIGGINFSEHNFAWHDAMLRIADREIADWLSVQFEREWDGRPRFDRREFDGGLTLLSLDGKTNEIAFGEVLKALSGARESIEVLSAYPTQPFTDAMAEAAARGVKVTLHTPRPNNKATVRDYLLGFAPANGIALSLLPEMTHAKCALVDGELLLFGSTNFDFASYRANNEFVGLFRDAALVDEVERRLLAPARAAGRAPRPDETTGFVPVRARYLLGAAEALVRNIGKGQRVRDWR